ncbi:hypothetical protein EDD85DRAFT_244403 [Armillaria nabsnona]|nr:hypothetical protein EDD85DRAFT_244403 [Armillaria nabsnona]
MALYITAAARIAQESLSLSALVPVHPLLTPAIKTLPKSIDSLKNVYIAVATYLDPRDSSLLSHLLVHPDMRTSSMLIESPEKPSITCFLDWQGASFAPVFVQVSLPALLSYTDGVFELDSEGCARPLPEDTDQRPSSRNTSGCTTSCYPGIGSTSLKYQSS